ncbi:hypothetical protein [Croceicoccus sp. YJ47]|uniref:hypothetical protein n=1 Tax=Croceicoccus sp. YJ47 TaxID=2798724 RepID=UPI001921C36D|nr:hypothetical protein JD971_02260 [Croceicoccus sp. YJ47]
MLRLPTLGDVFVHEMFHPHYRATTRFATIAQIDDQTRIAHGEPSELRFRHSGAAEKFLDVPNQQPNLHSATPRLR